MLREPKGWRARSGRSASTEPCTYTATTELLERSMMTGDPFAVFKVSRGYQSQGKWWFGEERVPRRARHSDRCRRPAYTFVRTRLLSHPSIRSVPCRIIYTGRRIIHNPEVLIPIPSGVTHTKPTDIPPSLLDPKQHLLFSSPLKNR